MAIWNFSQVKAVAITLAIALHSTLLDVNDTSNYLTYSNTSIINNLLFLCIRQILRCIPFYQPKLILLLVLYASPPQLYGTFCLLPLGKHRQNTNLSFTFLIRFSVSSTSNWLYYIYYLFIASESDHPCTSVQRPCNLAHTSIENFLIVSWFLVILHVLFFIYGLEFYAVNLNDFLDIWIKFWI